MCMCAYISLVILLLLFGLFSFSFYSSFFITFFVECKRSKSSSSTLSLFRFLEEEANAYVVFGANPQFHTTPFINHFTNTYKKDFKIAQSVISLFQFSIIFLLVVISIKILVRLWLVVCCWCWFTTNIHHYSYAYDWSAVLRVVQQRIKKK